MRWQISFLLFAAFLLPVHAHAVEERLDLDELVEEEKPKNPHHGHTNNRAHIMGRVDLTWDKTQRENSNTNNLDSGLKNQHFLLFLKAKPSKKVSFFGEFVSQSFYYIDYQVKNDLKLTIGKILIPFGENRYFHRYYGGLQGYGATGVMFPNIWAEAGVNVNFTQNQFQLDTYVVNAISAPNRTSDPDFQSSTSERQALGLRAQGPLMDSVQLLFSLYGSEYLAGRPLYIGGLDLYTNYGVWSLKHLRISLGIANAWVGSSPTGKHFQKRGDYLQLATNYYSWVELRMRYGTYIDDDRNESVNDTQSFNIGGTIPVDVMKILAEYQWNFEARNEIDNDLARLMISTDF